MKKRRGRPKLRLPIEVLEEIHNFRPGCRSEAEAIRKAIAKWKHVLSDKPFSRVKTAYQKFKADIGSRSVNEYRDDREYRQAYAAASADQERRVELRKRLEELELLAPEILATDLSDENLTAVHRHYWDDETIRKLREAVEDPPSDRRKAFIKLRGLLPPEEASKAWKEIREAVATAKRQSEWAGEILGLRSEIADLGRKKPGGQ